MTTTTVPAGLDERLHALERRVTVLERMVQLSQVLNSKLELDWLLQFIIDAAAELIGIEAASILLVDPNTRELRFEASTGTPRAELSAIPVPLVGSIAGSVFRENRPLVIPDVMKDPRWNPGVARAIHFQTRSILGVPMRIKDKVVGVLEAVNKRVGEFTENDVQTLSILADQAAVALENARLIAALQKAYSELNQLDRLKSDVIAIASHELRTPLSLVLGYAAFLKDDVSGEAREHAEAVLRSAQHLRSLTDNLANLRVLDAGEMPADVGRHELVALVRNAIDDVQSAVEAKSQSLELNLPEGPVYVMADAAKLGVVLANVLDNASRFTPEGGRIGVALARRYQEAWVAVSDTGPGIPPENLETIFTGFRQVEGHMTRRHGGLGVGLAIARGLIALQGGRIWAENGCDGGSKFTVTVPLAVG